MGKRALAEIRIGEVLRGQKLAAAFLTGRWRDPAAGGEVVKFKGGW